MTRSEKSYRTYISVYIYMYVFVCDCIVKFVLACMDFYVKSTP